jgi:RHS repeat-associated protein
VVVEVSENTPYGTLYHHEGTSTSPQQFTGQRLDTSTGLHFYNARYYDSQLGRFISPDPFVQAPSDPQTLNRYSYVRNNPINLVDPSGYGWFKKLIQRLFGGGDDSSKNPGGSTIFIPVAGPLGVGIDPARKEVFVGTQGDYGRAGYFYNYDNGQQGALVGAGNGNYYAEARVYHDPAEHQTQASIMLWTQYGSFNANTDGQRYLTAGGQSIRIKAAKAGELGATFGGPPSSATLQAIEGAGWMAVGRALMAGSAGATVATGGFALEVAAPLAIGGAVIAGVGALQVSYAVRAPFDTYPGQTQGKMALELNKAQKALTYGGPAEEIKIGGPPNLKGLPLWMKVAFYAGNIAKLLNPYLETVHDVLRR